MCDELLGAEAPYARLLSDAMSGEGALFTREEAVEAALIALDPVLRHHHKAIRYRRGMWGPKEADDLLGGHGSWHNPAAAGTGE